MLCAFQTFNLASFLNNFLHALLVHVLVQACGVWKPVECFLAGLRGRKRRGERCADLNFFAEFRSRSVSLNCCTCLLFIFEVRRRGWKVSGWWEKATLSPVWGCSCILPNCLVKGTFVLQWNISPFTPLDAVSPRFSFLRKTLSLQARVTDPPPSLFLPSGLMENLWSLSSQWL